MTILRSGSATDVGQVRSVNQDAILETLSLFAIADGMGGHAGGEIASHVAVETLRRTYEGLPPTLESLRTAIGAANDAILATAAADADLQGMGTTLTALTTIEQDNGTDAVLLANIGDSRAYLFSDGEIRQLTLDHSLAAEKVRLGELSEEEAAHHPQRHLLTRALGIEGEVLLDLWELAVASGDRIILCSDGLTNELGDTEIAEILSNEAEPKLAANDLVRAANARGGKDNISVVVIDVVVGGATDGSRTETSLLVEETEAGTITSVGTAAALSAAASVTMEPAATIGVAKVVAAEPASAAEAPPKKVIEDIANRPLPPKPEPTAIIRKRPRLINIRFVFFVALLIGIGYSAYAFIAWYAKSTYYVISQGKAIVIYQGQPSGTLWIKPKLIGTATFTTSQILASRLSDLASGVSEPNLTSAQNYAVNLFCEWSTTQPVVTTTTIATTTTVTYYYNPYTTTTLAPPTTLPKPLNPACPARPVPTYFIPSLAATK